LTKNGFDMVAIVKSLAGFECHGGAF
jgi:hypothetical protein